MIRVAFVGTDTVRSATAKPSTVPGVSTVMTVADPAVLAASSHTRPSLSAMEWSFVASASFRGGRDLFLLNYTRIAATHVTATLLRIHGCSSFIPADQKSSTASAPPSEDTLRRVLKL